MLKTRTTIFFVNVLLNVLLILSWNRSDFVFASSLNSGSNHRLIIGEVIGRVDPEEILALIKSGYYPVAEPSQSISYKIVQIESDEVVVKIEYPGRQFSADSPQQLVFKFFNSERALTSALITDQIDFAITESDEIAEEVEKSTNSVYIRHRLKKADYVKMLAFNNGKFPLNTRRVRQALTIAIDRKEIFETTFRKQAYFADGPLSQQSKNYASEIRGYKQDPRKALRLLMDDNWHDQNGDGILDKLGIPFRISLIYPKGVLLDEQIARRVKIDWSKIGVEVIIIPLPKSTIKYKLARHDYDVVLMGYQFEDSAEFFEQVFKSTSPGNFLSYRNKTVDRYFQFYHNVEQDSKKLLFRAIQTQIVKDYPAAFLFFPWLERIIVNTSRVANYRSKDQKIIPFIHWRIR
ncbi:MAG: hypothetical protein GXO74_00970 [Calditrichaeota bacterium]|nr:hypothetical protein [Calditrichota bacterium]